MQQNKRKKLFLPCLYTTTKTSGNGRPFGGCEVLAIATACEWATATAGLCSFVDRELTAGESCSEVLLRRDRRLAVEWSSVVTVPGKMFGGENSKPVFPVFLEENRLQFDSNASTQLQLFGNFPAGCNVDAVNYFGNDHDTSLNRPMKRGRETEDIMRQHKLQISLNNFYQDEADRSASIPNPNAVSTGLRLSYDDDELNSSVTSASGNKATLPVMLSLGDNVKIEIDRQEEEFDHYIKLQEEQIIKGVREMRQRHMTSFLSAIEKGVARKLREKELEIENMNRKNQELVERIKQVAAEAQSWYDRAQYNESVVNVLKNNLKQAIAQGADQVKEGCGDSEIDDAASSFDHNIIPGVLGKTGLGKGKLKEQMICRACKSKGVSILLLPCRHLCLCKDCQGFIEVCPICHSMKTASVQVYISETPNTN